MIFNQARFHFDYFRIRRAVCLSLICDFWLLIYQKLIPFRPVTVMGPGLKTGCCGS